MSRNQNAVFQAKTQVNFVSIELPPRIVNLSPVARLSPDESLGGHLHVAGLVHVDGALAAELQRARSDVLGGRRADDLAHVAASGVEDVVELVPQELGRFGDPAADDADAF